MHIFSVGKYVLIGEAVKENIWKNTRHCYNLPCYQRQAVSIDSNNRCRTSQANATNNYYRRSQHRCLTLTRKKIAGRIDMTKKKHDKEKTLWQTYIFTFSWLSWCFIKKSCLITYLFRGFQIDGIRLVTLSLCWLKSFWWFNQLVRTRKVR